VGETGEYTISSIIIIVWLIFPGVVFKRFYYQGQFTKQFGTGLFADRLITSLFWGIIVQITTFLVFSKVFNLTILTIEKQAQQLYENLSKNQIASIDHKTLTYILTYLICLVIVATMLGILFHRIIRFFKIDVRVNVFRFANHWNYYFKGEILETEEFKSLKTGKWDSTLVDLIIADGSPDNKVVSGYLTQYTLSHKTGDLEAIYLTQTKRFSKSQNQFVPIPGDCFIVLFDKVIDMNLRYNQIKPTVDVKLFLRLIVYVLGYILLIGILVYPWFLDLRLLNKILGIVFGLTAWVFLISSAMYPLQQTANPKITRQAFKISLAVAIVFSIITLVALKLLPYVR